MKIAKLAVPLAAVLVVLHTSCGDPTGSGNQANDRIAIVNDAYALSARVTYYDDTIPLDSTGVRKDRWGVRADGGLGIQQVGAGAPTQSEWHAGLAITRGWSANSELAILGSLTNSAASRSGTATAAGFKYAGVTLRLRQGL